MKLKQAILSLLLCLISVTAQAQQFSPFIDTRLRSTATGTKPAMRSGALLELIGYTTATDGFHSVVQYLPGSALVVDNIFVFAPKAGQPGRLVAVDRSFIDLEFAGLSNNADITTLLDTAADNMTGSVFRMRLPRTLTNLTCAPITFPTGLKRLEVFAGNCTITQINPSGFGVPPSQTIWTIPNPQNVFIERGVKFIGLNAAAFTNSEAGLIKIDGTAKTGVGGTIECHADFSDTVSTGLAVVGVDDEANAYESIVISGKYTDSGINASSYALTRTADADIYDLTNYNGTNAGSRRYTNQPHVLQDGYPPLQARPSLSQGNYDRSINVRTHHGHDEFEDMVGVDENAGAYINLPAGSTWQLTGLVRIPTGVTITTDPNNPATVIHPPTGQGCIAIQGADILFENFICDFKSGPRWQHFQNFFNHTAGGFFTGAGASSKKFQYDTLAFGPFILGENVTIGNGTTTTGRLVGYSSRITIVYDGLSGSLVAGDVLTFGGGGSGILIANTGGNTLSVTWTAGALPVNNASITGPTGSALVNGTPSGSLEMFVNFVDDETAFANNETITGLASGATAVINGSVSITGSVPLHPIKNITYRNLTFINSDDTRRNFPKDTDWSFAYDQKTGVDFVEGDTINFNSGGTGTLFQVVPLTSTTGTMIVIRESGAVPANDALITTPGSNAAAVVNGTVTAHGHTQDGWCISFVSNSGACHGLPASDVLIEGCRNLIQFTQLTANGSEAIGWKNITIRNNFIKFGHANAIAISSLSDVTTFENFLIEGNEILECTSVGIYVGLDPDGTGIGGLDDVNLIDITIRDNHIKWADEPEIGSFPIAVLIRCTGNCKRLRIEGNTFESFQLIESADLTWIDLRGNPVGPDNTYLIADNTYLGDGGDFEIGSEYVQYFDDLPLMKDLIAWFPCDELNTSDPVLDVVGPTGRSTLGTATGVTAVADGPGGARARGCFGTTRAYGPDLDWNRAANNSITISAWVRVDHHIPGQSNCVVAKYGTGGSYQINVNGTTGLPSFTVRGSGASAGVTDDTALTPNQWHHIVGWYDWPSYSVGIAVDGGAPVYNTVGVPGSIGDANLLFNLGYDGSNSSSFLDGDVSQVGFWRGRVLSAKDRTDLYNAGNGLPFDTDDFEVVIE